MDYMSVLQPSGKIRILFKCPGAFAAIACCAALLLRMDAGHAESGTQHASEWIPEVLIYTDSHTDHQDPTPPRVVIVDKSRQEIILFNHHEQWHAVRSWPCSTGKRQGPKQVEGDSKTPEGVYFVTRHVESRYLTDTYGSRALTLDFPNWLDRHQKRTGSAIWLHGTNKPLRPRDSNGCIVMMNDAIDDLAGYIQLNQTPVIVVGKIHWQTNQQAENLANQLLAIADQWNSALMSDNYAEYQKTYATDSIPAIQWWDRWCDLRKRFPFDPGRLNSRMRQRRVFRGIAIYVLLFDHYIEACGQIEWIGRRKLYLREQDGKILIIGDTYQERPLSSSDKNRDDTDPLLHAWTRLWQKTGGHALVADQRQGGKNQNKTRPNPIH